MADTQDRQETVRSAPVVWARCDDEGRRWGVVTTASGAVLAARRTASGQLLVEDFQGRWRGIGEAFLVP